MKLKFTLIALLIGILSCKGQQFQAENLIFNVLSEEEKTCTLSGEVQDMLNITFTDSVYNSENGNIYKVTEISDSAFYGHSTEWISLPNSIKKIGKSAFANCQLTFAEIGGSVNHIGDYAFFNNQSSLRISNNNPEPALIGKEICNLNTTWIVPGMAVDSYKSQWGFERVFSNDTIKSLNIDQVRVKPGVPYKIHYKTEPENCYVKFEAKSGLISVRNDSIFASTLMDDCYASMNCFVLYKATAYSACSVYVEPLDSIKIDGIVYGILSESEVTVKKVTEECLENVKIPLSIKDETGRLYSVTQISEKAFFCNKKLKSVSIPASVREIGNNNFNGCNNLSQIIIEDSEQLLQSYGYSFDNGSVVDLYLGRDVSDHTLYFISNGVANLTISKYVTRFGESNLTSMPCLQIINCQNPVPIQLHKSIYSSMGQLKIVVPAGSEDDYKAAWGELFEGAIFISNSAIATKLSIEKYDSVVHSRIASQITYTVEPADALVYWTASNYSNVVNENGVVTTYYDGDYEFTITAHTLNGLTAQCEMRNESYMRFSNDVYVVPPGTTYQAKISTIDIAKGFKQVYSVSRDCERYLKVSESGLITGMSYGLGSIDVSLYDDNNLLMTRKNAYVEVKKYPSEIEISDSVIFVESGNKETITDLLLITPPNNVSYYLDWESADSTIAYVERSIPNYTAKGYRYYLHGNEPGNVKITGKSFNGLPLSFEARVYKEVDSSLVKENEYIKLGESKHFPVLDYFIESNQEISYLIDDPSIISIDDAGNVTGLSYGKTTVRVNLSPQRYSVTLTFSVCEYPDNVTLMNREIEIIGIGNSLPLVLNFQPNDAHVSRDILWEIENQDIARIVQKESLFQKEDGSYVSVPKYEVYAHGLGKTNFKGITPNGLEINGAITIKGFDFTVPSIQLTVGDEIDIPIDVSSNEILDCILWTYDSNIEINEKGHIIANSVGDYTLTGSGNLYGWEFKRSIRIYVRPKSGTLGITSQDLYMREKSNEELYIYYPWDETDHMGIWKIEDESVATLQYSYNDHARIKAISKGSTMLSYKSNSGLQTSVNIRVWSNASDLVLDKNEVSLNINDTCQIYAKIIPDDTNQIIKWSSDNPTIVSVNEQGILTALKGGNTRVTAYFNGISNYRYVDVSVKELPQKFKFPYYSMYIETGNYYFVNKYEISYQPSSSAVDRTILWEISDPSIVSIEETEEGYYFYGIKNGNATVTARTKNGLQSNIDIQVWSWASSVDIIPNEIDGKPGDSIQLECLLKPSNTNQIVYWYSDDNRVAKVNENGLVSIVGYGETTIYACVNEFMTMAECKIKSVLNPESVELSAEYIEVKRDSTLILLKDFIQILPEESANKSIEWVVNDENVLNIEEFNDEYHFHALKAVDTYAEAKTWNGIKARLDIHIYDIAHSISLSHTHADIEENKELLITAKTDPMELNEPIIWESSNEEVAIVSPEGLVTGLTSGTTIITAIANSQHNDENITAACLLNVYNRSDGVDGINEDGGVYDVYTTTGILLRANVRYDYIETLTSGIYILRKGNKSILLNIK